MSGREPISSRLRAQLQDALPADVRVLTLEEFIARERDFWDKVAPMGTVFYIGVVMGFIVGCVICYQVLFSDISDRIGEFATLKAMGYSNLRLFRVVVMQGVYLALLGYLAGLAVSLLLFRWVHEATGLPLDLSRNDPLVILLLSIVMCVLSGAYAGASSCRLILPSFSPERCFLNPIMTETGTYSTLTSVAVMQPARADVVIRAAEVNYAYGTGETRTQVLFDNDLEISRGEVVIMTGPSGSGKSTLLTLIGALRRMQEGSLEVLDHDLSNATETGSGASSARTSVSSSSSTTCSARSPRSRTCAWPPPSAATCSRR